MNRSILQCSHKIFPFLVIAVVLAACTPQASPGLVVEEHALLGVEFVGESIVFDPVTGTMTDVLAKHSTEREKLLPATQINGTASATLDGRQLTARVEESGGQMSIVVTRDGEPIHTTPLESPALINPLQGFQVVDNHWILEIAHTSLSTGPDGQMVPRIWGEIIQDGISLNADQGYNEAFGFQLLAGNPFYFFRKDGQFSVVYNGKEILSGYTDIRHYLCCSGAALNPMACEDMVAFFATRDGQDFYVEIGFFEE